MLCPVCTYVHTSGPTRDEPPEREDEDERAWRFRRCLCVVVGASVYLVNDDQSAFHLPFANSLNYGFPPNPSDCPSLTDLIVDRNAEQDREDMCAWTKMALYYSTLLHI